MTKIEIPRTTAKEIMILMAILKDISSYNPHKKRADKIYNELNNKVFGF